MNTVLIILKRQTAGSLKLNPCLVHNKTKMTLKSKGNRNDKTRSANSDVMQKVQKIKGRRNWDIHILENSTDLIWITPCNFNSHNIVHCGPGVWSIKRNNQSSSSGGQNHFDYNLIQVEKFTLSTCAVCMPWIRF